MGRRGKKKKDSTRLDRKKMQVKIRDVSCILRGLRCQN